MKRIGLVFSLLLLLWLGSCGGSGELVVTLTPDVETAVVNQAVSFSVAVVNEEKFNTYYYILDDDGIEIDKGYVEGGSFEYSFAKACSHSVEVVVETSNDYGSTSALFDVESNLNIPDWSLSEKVVMGGDTTLLDLSSLNDPKIKQIDIRFIEAKENGKTAYFVKKVSGTYLFDTAIVEPGNYMVTIALTDDGGNIVFIERPLIIMDPNNPIAIELTASDEDPAYENTIHVSGTIDSEHPIEDVVLVRTVYHGREQGVNPLAEPNMEGGISYFEPGREIVSHEERYSIHDANALLTYDSAAGTFAFTDPMNYYNENNAVEETGFKWSYAKFDREAWKYIKRNQRFDFKKAVAVEYKLIATSTKGPVETPVETGHPYLGKFELTALYFWMKDVAINRLWKMQLPRYAYNKTQTWMASQSVKGQRQGSASFVKDGMGGYGMITKYSDWPGCEVSTRNNIALALTLDLKPNQRRQLDFSVNVVTPLYRGYFDLVGLGVRDYTLQWGMWISGDGTPDLKAIGDLTIVRKLADGSEVTEMLNTEELTQILPLWGETGHWSVGFGNGYDEKDYTGLDHEPSSWTKIHFFYPPTPTPDGDGVWGHKEQDWVMNYDYNN